MQRKPVLESSRPGGTVTVDVTWGWAHDINDPLGVITANVDYLFDQLQGGPRGLQDLKESLEEVRAAAGRIRDVVRRMTAHLPTGLPAESTAQGRAAAETRTP